MIRCSIIIIITLLKWSKGETETFERGMAKLHVSLDNLKMDSLDKTEPLPQRGITLLKTLCLLVYITLVTIFTIGKHAKSDVLLKANH